MGTDTKLCLLLRSQLSKTVQQQGIMCLCVRADIIDTITNLPHIIMVTLYRIPLWKMGNDALQ